MSERLHGVSLDQYATVLAGLGDGLREAEILAFAGVDPRAWRRAEEAWGARLLDDLDVDGPLEAALEEATRSALQRWARPLPPLDADLAAYLDFDRAHAHAVDEEAFLAALGMRPQDVTRLAALWGRRFIEDRALAARAVALLAEPPGPPPVPRPEPARLVPALTPERKP